MCHIVDPHQKRSMQIAKLNCTPTSSTLKGITPFAQKHNNLNDISTSIKTPTLNKKFITTLNLGIGTFKNVCNWKQNMYFAPILNTIAMDRNPTLSIRVVI
jgi:hypothetical protein